MSNYNNSEKKEKVYPFVSSFGIWCIVMEKELFFVIYIKHNGEISIYDDFLVGKAMIESCCTVPENYFNVKYRNGEIERDILFSQNLNTISLELNKKTDNKNYSHSTTEKNNFYYFFLCNSKFIIEDNYIYRNDFVLYKFSIVKNPELYLDIVKY